ncbi:MAG: hypothetical protein ACR2NR_13570 [Solirubrobacteraceae bacterium]
MHDQPIFSAATAPHTADVASLLAADQYDVATRVHELTADGASETDYRMASALLDAPWEQVGPDQVGPGTSAQHTADVAEMIAAGHCDAARSMHEAYVKAEFECEDVNGDAPPANMVDIWLAGELLVATFEPA